MFTISIFAVVGAALAFKAKKYNQSFCVATTVNIAASSLLGQRTIGFPAFRYYYTPTTNPGFCGFLIIVRGTTALFTTLE